jgi:broad specificity phosphatase PhoE
VVYRWAKDIPLELPRTFAVPNGGVNRLRIERHRWSIETWADTGHLPPGALDDE